MAKLPKKDYYRLSELAAECGCAVEDIIHHFLHGRIRLGIRVHDELLYGMNADLHTIGAYYVSGVLTVPTSCAEAGWEFDPQGPAQAGGLLIEPDYPPDIMEASYIAEDSVPPAFWAWAPGRDWDNPETDHSRIERFGVGFTGIDESGNPIFDWQTVDPARLVVHAVERESLLRDQAENEAQAAPPAAATAAGTPDTTGFSQGENLPVPGPANAPNKQPERTIKEPCRADDLAIELVEILKNMAKKGERPTPAAVMGELQAHVDWDRSCIEKVGPNCVWWLNSRTGRTKKCDMETLGKRLDNLLEQREGTIRGR